MGCCMGHACTNAEGLGLPKSSRAAAVTALTGFQLATARRAAGMWAVGTSALETIAKLPHLSWLQIKPGSKITDNGLKSLESARILSRLEVSNVSQAAAQSLANVRPDVDVSWEGKRLEPANRDTVTSPAAN